MTCTCMLPAHPCVLLVHANGILDEKWLPRVVHEVCIEIVNHAQTVAPKHLIHRKD